MKSKTVSTHFILFVLCCICIGNSFDIYLSFCNLKLTKFLHILFTGTFASQFAESDEHSAIDTSKLSEHTEFSESEAVRPAPLTKRKGNSSSNKNRRPNAKKKGNLLETYT